MMKNISESNSQQEKDKFLLILIILLIFQSNWQKLRKIYLFLLISQTNQKICFLITRLQILKNNFNFNNNIIY